MATFTITITTNVNKDKGIARALAIANDARARQSPPASPLTTDQFVQMVCDDLFQTYARDYKVDLRQRVSDAVDTATAAKVTQVAQILGVTE